MFKIVFIILFFLILTIGFYHTHKPLPKNISYESEEYQLSSNDVYFLKDETYLDKDGKRQSDHEIFDEVFKMIDEAEHYILLDFFLYNDFMGTSEDEPYRYLSTELTDKLIKKKADNPEITIQFITDPINTVYGGYKAKNLEKLKQAGVSVIVTDLTALRDSNPIYSSVWRTFFKWMGNSDDNGYLPNPFDSKAKKLSLRTYLSVLNYKANHRKVAMADYNRGGKVGLSVLVTSANPHDGSSSHSNTALRVDSDLWQDLLKTEATVAEFSNQEFIYPDESFINRISDSVKGNLKTQLITEQKIENKVVEAINNLERDDSLSLAMFYLSDREVVDVLKEADRRGVKVRIILDPNKDAFGREKNGVPNRQVADELVSNTKGNTEIRWCDTHGEQCHSKMMLAKSKNGVILIQGSANFTKRNLDDFNLETDILVSGPETESVFVKAEDFFNRQWNNGGDRVYTTNYETYEDNSLIRKIVYRFKEFSGLSRW